MRIALSAIAALALVLSACGGAGTAQPSAAPATVKIADDAKLGKILVSASGMTLYTFDKDTDNVATCYDACAANWPALTLASGTPVAAAGMTGKLATTDRKEGTKQVTWNGKPLYFYAKDKAAGDTTGDNVGTVWHVVKNP